MAPLIEPALIVTTPDCPGRTRPCEPITVGVPLPRGVVMDPGRIGLLDEGGRTVPVQVQATERWPDGSVRWALCDFQSTGHPAPGRPYRLQFLEEPRPGISAGIRVEESDERVVVDTGAARFTLQPGPGFPFASAQIGSAAAIDGAASGLSVTDAAGR